MNKHAHKDAVIIEFPLRYAFDSFQVVDTIPERKHVHWVREFYLAAKKTITFDEF